MTSDYYAPFGGRKYVRLSLDACERRAKSERYELFARVEFAALWRANDHGHAGFRPNELAGVLGTMTPDGSWLPVSPSQVSRAIRTAKDAGAIAEDSTARCLITIAAEASQGRNGQRCDVHRI